MKYIIKAYTPVETPEPEIFDSLQHALEVQEELESMQPENIYPIERYKEPKTD